MKDVFLLTLQALLCICVAAGLYVLSGRYQGDVHDGIVALAGVTATLWFRIPRVKEGAPPSAALPLLVFVFALGTSSCSAANRHAQMNVVEVATQAANRHAQMNVVEVATQAANELGQGMVALYGYQLQHCVEDSATEMAYIVCKMGVDQVWGKTRVAYASLRRVQDEYATALEKGEIKAADFLEWFRIAFCELRAAAPPELVLPPVPALTCGDVGQ